MGEPVVESHQKDQYTERGRSASTRPAGTRWHRGCGRGLYGAPDLTLPGTVCYGRWAGACDPRDIKGAESVLPAAALIASLAFLALVVTAIPMLVQLGRTARSAEQTLMAVERELRPLASQVQALLQEHRNLAQQATRDLREVEGLALRGQEVLTRLTSLTSVLGSMGAVGKVVGVAQGFRKGADVFIRRLRRPRG
ncbi:MAG: hypothetical protein DMD79_01725 [Candidatus Rokuibacteriota bacterium]|nr:MAG: hypothetical protein DMD79_01725 [Candidatus Rokubacteria bacterium]